GSSGAPICEMGTVWKIARQRVQHGHAHGDAHLHLFTNEAAVNIVGDCAVDFHAPVHRAGMHDERIWLRIGELCVVEAVEVEIFALRGHIRAAHALKLKAQHHHDINTFEALLHIVEDFHAKPFHVGRHERRRSYDAYTRTHRMKQENVRAGDAAVKNITANGDEQTLKAALAAADRQDR